MANPKHLKLLEQGVDAWRRWREEHEEETADLSQADLRQADLGRAKLHGANLYRADLDRAELREADLRGAKLHGANLREADLRGANLSKANLRGADLRGADLSGAYLRGADLRGANLREANLVRTSLVETNLTQANMNGCRIYGVSAWNLQIEGAHQSDLVITKPSEPAITVDNLEVAQFIYLLLNNERIRGVIDAITSKVVLILGRFSEERKTVLDAIREELRRRNFTPILFDFDKPASKDVTGTVETLARMARFIIADLTDPSSIPYELGTVVPLLRTTPVLTLRLEGASGFSMFEDLHAYPWVLPTHEYQDAESLVASLVDVIESAETKVRQLRGASEGGPPL